MLIIVLAAVVTAIMSGCGKSDTHSQADGKVNVVTSFYPLYFFAKEIGGEHAHVVNLIAAGVEPHEWTPKSRDLDAASKAQLFLYNGAGLEGWVDNFLNGLGSGSQVLTVEASKGIELIQGNPEHDHDHEGAAEEADDHDHDSEEGGEADHSHSDLDVDPHTWTSPRSALVMAANIRDAFVQADPANKAAYESNYAGLESRLRELDDKFTQGLAGFERRDIVVSHQAFGYLCRDYNLNQIAIMGLSPEAEPRAQDLLEIAKFVKENGIPYIFFEELVSEQLANTLASEAKVDTLVLNPLEGLTPEQEKAGEDYFTLMERNLENLQKALG
ncbi:metal ABC transporter substrate-binding protein [Cohnella cellulosilytica]|uniref:Metal ABC transporter substrate-binding protein n=1 Tax=Cohnella cellulosilytica TaxID=986710 RepID=A0ABW2F6B9_9BACL